MKVENWEAFPKFAIKTIYKLEKKSAIRILKLTLKSAIKVVKKIRLNCVCKFG